jgi:hypothetical protein
MTAAIAVITRTTNKRLKNFILHLFEKIVRGLQPCVLLIYVARVMKFQKSFSFVVAKVGFTGS